MAVHGAVVLGVEEAEVSVASEAEEEAAAVPEADSRKEKK